MNQEKNETGKPLRILHIEDSPRDAELIRERLIDAGFSLHLDWASNEQEFTDFLRNNTYELILADYQLPGFEAPAALELAKAHCPGIPFICVSGAIGEEKAVELLKQGATDYVLKGRLAKLPLAVRRALNEVEERTARKLAEEQIVRSLQEKEVMLKEIHHRVKNNMQVIVSLLHLQANSIEDKTVRAKLEESRSRVFSMALIHEKLYRAADLAHINFKEYLQSLIAGIADTYRRHDVVYFVDMGPLALDVNVGIPCGLIVNELVSNCLKHAFPDGRTGRITLGLTKNSEGKNVLFVADNGTGFPAAIDFRNTASLGLQLVNVLTGQVHGTLELDASEGTKFSITFPASK